MKSILGSSKSESIEITSNYFVQIQSKGVSDCNTFYINPLPDMPILGSSSSVANKDMMSKIWTNGDSII